MTRQDLYGLLENGPILLDGATGSNLMKVGMPMGVCPEKWIMDHPDAILDLQRAYVEAGSQILYAPTFTANRIKLAEYGLEDRLVEINRTMVRLCREAAEDKAYVAADFTMTGQQLYPTGDLLFEDLVDIYKEQVQAVLEEGVDLFVVETMMSLQECRAALLAIKETTDLPVMVTLTYNEDGRTLYGTEPDTAMIVLQSMGADVVGINCSTGPKDMVALVEKMAEYANVPILVKPNAGMPELIDGETLYRLEPDTFAKEVADLVAAGANIIGGCCGTTPAHIKALTDYISSMKYSKRYESNEKARVVTSERKKVDIELDGRFLVVGERINPTGKKKLQEELRSGSLEMVRDMALSQEENGAAILDINMGTNGIDEKQMMVNAIYEVAYTVDCPLCIDTSYVDVMEAALRIYPGRALINSISFEEEKMKELLPIAKKYGAMFVLLPLSKAGLPDSIEEKHANIHGVIDAAKKYGLSERDAVVDLLVATVGADPNSALDCFATVDYCHNEIHVPTICGLSNISFGMPQRIFVNTAFLNVAISKGLNMAIANPSQELLMYTAFATDMLLNKDGATEKYLESANKANFEMVSKNPSGSGAASASSTTDGSIFAADMNRNSDATGNAKDDTDPVLECVVKGNKNKIVAAVEVCLNAGETPSEIINNHLIPGINVVGDYYDSKKYFLPQLIAGANAMKIAMEYLEPMLVSDDTDEAKDTIIMATVEGDIHDIGKNLVVLMLKNYGFRVIDMGKDIPAANIVDLAMTEQAAVIGLSALMTTTMMKMKEVVEVAKEKGCTAKIIIGGAAITESFADEIGADGYSGDAADCVKLVQKLTGK